MIVIQLKGGLGNQMFEYATGLSLAKKNNTSLKIDLSWFGAIGDDDVKREYELDCFKLDQDFVDRAKLFIINETKTKKLHKKIVAKVRGKKLLRLYTEESLLFNKNFENLKDNTYLNGYFQSEKYFTTIKPDVIKSFSFKIPANTTNEKLIQLAKKTNSVSLHVRRGDYVTNIDANKVHGLKDIDYYKRALSTVKRKIDNPKLFVFSDDIAWCRANLPVHESSVFVEHNTKGSEDLRIMIHCKHNIIANSSFSWWGAWLNQNPNKIVIAPAQWFNDNSMESSDIVPDGWVRI